MNRLRRILHRALKPLAMFGVVGAVSLSLIVTTPSNAQAFTARDVKAAETFVMGATKTLAPAANVALAAASFTPVGFGVRLLQLGMLAYSTSDIWMPIVAGAFGAPVAGDGPNGSAPSGAGAGTADPAFTLGALSLVGAQVKMPISYSKPGPGSYSVHYSYRVECRNASTGVVTMNNRVGNIGGGLPAPSGIVLNLTCTAENGANLGTPIGAAAGLAGYLNLPLLPAPTTPVGGPSNFVSWGTQKSAGDPGFDPYGSDVKYKVKSECIGSDGTKSTIEAESSGDYLRFPSCEAAGKGHGTGKTSITGLAPGTTIEKPLWDSPAAPSDPATPLCDASRPSGGCVLSVELDGKPCSSADIECQNWAELEKTTPNNSRLRCKLGPYTLPTSSCALLEKAYFPGGAPATSENTDGNPDTAKNTAPSGAPLAPPAPTGTGTTTGTIPGGSGQPQAGDSPAEKNCYPTGWAAMNPVEWVMKPVGCALTAAFVPKQEVVTAQTTRLDTKIKNVGFQRISTAWMSTFQAAAGGSGCTGPTVNFSMEGVTQNFQPFNACTQPMAGVAAITNAVSCVFIVLFGGLGIMRAIGTAFGFNFSMGRGSDGD